MVVVIINNKKQKIPISISVYEGGNTKQISIGMSLSDLSKTPNFQQKMDNFKIKYEKLVDNITKIKKSIDKSKKNNAPKYWEISDLIKTLQNNIDDELDVVNWKESILRECVDIKGIGRANSGVLKDFALFFKKDEIYENVSWSHYWEFTLKSRKLQQVGIFDDVKADFLRRGKNNELPPHKDLRKELAQKIQLKAK